MRRIVAVGAALIAAAVSLTTGPVHAAVGWRQGTGGRDDWRDGRHRDFHGFGAFGLYAWPPWYWDPDFAYGWPVYRYSVQPSVIYTPPAAYDVISPPAAPPVRYYCPGVGYYPAVPACPRGWLRVVPDNPR